METGNTISESKRVEACTGGKTWFTTAYTEDETLITDWPRSHRCGAEAAPSLCAHVYWVRPLLAYADDAALAAESEELRTLLMKVKEKSEKAGLQVNILVRSWHPVPSLRGKYTGKQWKQSQTLFYWAPKSLQMVIVAMKLKDAYSLKEKL